jgi:nucleotide-binding universal stress UspA family protein|tara:strand:- start:12552 stop:12977 length:426 start_codon:yes stop_codon:yes gene_type:complete
MYKDILLTVDLSDSKGQQKATEVAVDLAEKFGCRLHVCTVVPDYGMSIVGDFFPKAYEKKALEHVNATLHEWTRDHISAGISVQHIVGHGTIYSEILRYAGETKCDLIVMASHRPGLEDYLLGPNAARVVRHAKMSVLVVR